MQSIYKNHDYPFIAASNPPAVTIPTFCVKTFHATTRDTSMVSGSLFAFNDTMRALQ